MNILIAGASGFIGRALVARLQSDHVLTVLGRDIRALERHFPPAVNKTTWDKLSGLNASTYEVIINLCGTNISASRWNTEVKQQIIESRVKTTGLLIDWVIQYGAQPHFISANAIGIYGPQDSNDPSSFDENSPIDFEHAPDFLSEVGIQWQKALQPAIDFGMPVTIGRFGVVIGKEDGMLKKLWPSFYFGAGSIIGDGKQVLSWIQRDDLVAALKFLLDNPELTGVFNLTSPNPVSQAEFANTLAAVMHRPRFLKMPTFVVRLLFGEMGECLLLKGQRVVPTRLLNAGFKFRHAGLKDALEHEIKSPS